MYAREKMLALAVAAAVAALAVPASAQEVTGGATTTGKAMSSNLVSITQPMLNGAAADAKNWIHSNGSYDQTRYYPGNQINSGNVAKLAPKFVFQTAVLESMETAPIVVNGVMFLTTSFNHVYAIDATGEELNPRRLTNLPTIDQMPAWSPNGQQIAFMSLREGYCSVFLMSAEGDTPEHPAVNLTPKTPGDANSAWCSRAPSWSRNGQQIYFQSFRPSTGGDVELFVMNADGSGVQRLTVSAGEDGGPRVR